MTLLFSSTLLLSGSGPGSRPLRFERLERRVLLATWTDLPQLFVPAKDADLAQGAATDGAELTVGNDASGSGAYLAFYHTGFGGAPIQGAQLRLQAARDAAFAELEVHHGSGSLWTERNLGDGNAPQKLALLDAFAGPLTAGQWIELDVTPAIRGSGLVNFVLSGSAGSEEFAFSSREGAASPELAIVAAQAAPAGDFNGNLAVDGFDFLVWQRGRGAVQDPADPDLLTGWETAFGAAPVALAPANVFDYGAGPDDQTFDDAAIQQAIDVNASVYLPPGEYWLNSRLVLPAGRRLLGPATGPSAVLRVRHDTGGLSSGLGIEVRGDGVTVQDLVVDKDFVDGSYGVGLHAEQSDHLFVSGVEIRNYSARYGIHVLESDYFEIASVYVHDFWMNDRDAGGIGADMIQDSPAGIRVTRSSAGTIRDSRIHNIEVGPQGRASISERVPSYGAQGYQADAITLSDSTAVIVEGNNLWNSGELVDVLVSEESVVRNNVMQMAYLLGVKVIGSQNTIVTDNYIGDAAIGLWMGDHDSGRQATGNRVADNDFVNNGSPGIWNHSASARIPFGVSAVNVDSNADGNSATDNTIYDFYGYLPRAVREGSGGNLFANNEVVSDRFGPPGSEAVTTIGAWTAGLFHPPQYVTINRALVFFAFAESVGASSSLSGVTYGKRPMTRVSQREVAGPTGRLHVSAWILMQDDVNRADTGAFVVQWSEPPGSAAYASVFLANVDQVEPLFAEDTGQTLSTNLLSTSPRPSPTGGLALYAAAAATPGSFMPGEGFAETAALDFSLAVASVGFTRVAGGLATASATHDEPGVGAISMLVLQGNRAADAPRRRVDVTTLGALPNDGLNDATIVQNALNSPNYDEIYFPPGTYHFDRPVFVRSGKSVRGEHRYNTRIETLADVTVFRVDDNTTNASISELTIARAQTDSDNEIVRIDRSDRIVVESLQILGGASRAPIINIRGGDGNIVRDVTVVDYQVLRAEPSPEQPGLHIQVFGSGITLVDNTNFEVVGNLVFQNASIDFPTPGIKGVYQASAIQIVNSSDGLVQENRIRRTGQGIDTTGSSFVNVSDNFIEECHSAGVKLVNGGRYIVVEDNHIERCGLTGVWVSVGVAGLGGSAFNVVRNNTFEAIGKGIGQDFWNGNFAFSTPAAIHLQAAQQESDRVRFNVIVDNLAYDNEELVGMVVSEPSNAGSPLPAVDNDVSNNILAEGPSPQ